MLHSPRLCLPARVREQVEYPRLSMEALNRQNVVQTLRGGGGGEGGEGEREKGRKRRRRERKRWRIHKTFRFRKIIIFWLCSHFHLALCVEVPHSYGGIKRPAEDGGAAGVGHQAGDSTTVTHKCAAQLPGGVPHFDCGRELMLDIAVFPRFHHCPVYSMYVYPLLLLVIKNWTVAKAWNE